MARCPTCGRGEGDALPDFLVGERVEHKNGAKGTVVEVGPFCGSQCVMVEFDEGWRGAYDAAWFRIHAPGLVRTTVGAAKR